MADKNCNVQEEIGFLVTWLGAIGLSADGELVQSAHDDLGQRYAFVGQYRKAIEHYGKLLSIAEHRGDKEGQGIAFRGLGQCYFGLSQYDKALKEHTMQLKIAQETGNRSDEAEANACLGMCYGCLSQYDTAIKHNKMCLDIAVEINSSTAEGTAHGNLGNCHSALGDFQQAIQHHEKFRDFARRLGDKAGEATALGNLGNCCLPLGQTDRAISYHEESLSIAEQIGYVAGRGIAFVNLGNCYRVLGQYEKAIKYQEIAMEVSMRSGDKTGLAKAHGNIGNCYLWLGKYDKAAEHYGTCRDIAREIGDVAGEGTATGNLASCYTKLGQYHDALKHSEMHVKIAKQIRDKAGEGRAHANLGISYQGLGQHAKAVEHYEFALHLVKWKSDEAATRVRLISCYVALGKYEEAEDNGREGLQCYENLFENAPKQDELKVSILDTFSNPYKLLAQVLLLRNKKEEALVIAERGRSKALRDLILSSRLDRHTESSTTHAQALGLHQICEVVKTLDSPVLFFVLFQEQTFTWTIKPTGEVTYTHVALGPEVRETNSPTDKAGALSVEKVETLNSLINKAMSVVLSRCIANCEDRSMSFLYPVEESGVTKTEPRTANAPVLVAAPPRKAEESSRISTARLLNDVASSPPEVTGKAMLQGTSAPASKKIFGQTNDLEDTEMRSVLKELYQVFFAPARQSLDGPRVVIVPDDNLSFVPFAALVDDQGRYVAETLQVRLIPSLGTARMVLEYPRVERAACPLVIGNPAVGEVLIDGEVVRVPRLPHANKEAEMIGKLLNVAPLTGHLATKKAFLQKVESANLIHIAAHGDAERGEILLAPSPGSDKTPELEDVMLTLSDLEDKRMSAKLVVLSCCHSGRGAVRAEGVVGIARAFLGAGASAVLVALWAINDEATASFMCAFYERLVSGERPGDALDMAMRALRMTATFRHPRYWAPFVLMGDDVAPVSVGGLSKH